MRQIVVVRGHPWRQLNGLIKVFDRVFRVIVEKMVDTFRFDY